MSEHNLSDLDELARQWPILFGKAVDPAEAICRRAALMDRSGRPDFIDDKSPEIQRALRALDRLYELHSNPSTQQAAEVLLYARVFCGREARLMGTVYLQIALSYRRTPKKMTPTKQKELVAFGREQYELACLAYRAALPHSVLP
jgi:hypothetical protein